MPLGYCGFLVSGYQSHLFKSLEISLIRCQFVKRCMLSGYVVPVEPVCHVFGKLGSRFIYVQVDSLILQRAPEPFDEDVVPETSFAVHADFDVPSLEHGRECFTCKLAALVGVENLRGAVFEQSFFERLYAESGPAYWTVARTEPFWWPSP